MYHLLMVLVCYDVNHAVWDIETKDAKQAIEYEEMIIKVNSNYPGCRWDLIEFSYGDVK